MPTVGTGKHTGINCCNEKDGKPNSLHRIKSGAAEKLHEQAHKHKKASGMNLTATSGSVHSQLLHFKSTVLIDQGLSSSWC
ncbi:hypothetical protein K2173_006307 [Erythroxylum novogranatense]|uniref:Uncharacterized protein n=1 Tax=Erythroxylum novogranatense TaxID=1862640 RepID=A0AAV8TCV3_9ROSI|nr:hypothetical protein K2173_006307 [Erythroxylum novogranatense]